MDECMQFLESRAPGQPWYRTKQELATRGGHTTYIQLPVTVHLLQVRSLDIVLQTRTLPVVHYTPE